MTDLAQRQSQIAKQMQTSGIDGVLLASNVNLLYASGAVFSGYAYISAGGEVRFFTTKPTGHDPEGAIAIRKPEEIPNLLKDAGIAAPQTVWFEEDEIGAGEWHRLRALFPDARPMLRVPLMRRARAVKTPYERQMIAAAAQRQNAVYEKVPQLFKPGMTDDRLAIEVEREMRLMGFDGLFRTHGFRMEAHMGLILAGANAQASSPYDFALGGSGQDAAYPLGQSGTRIEGSMTVLLDIAFAHKGYLSDTSRVFSVGTLPDAAYRLHDLGIDIVNTLADMARPGMPASELYFKAMDMVAKAGQQDVYMGLHAQAGFVGHGVGLAINEFPILAPRDHTPLEEGMALAIEPKFIVGEYGAVGLENTYFVGPNGLENLCHAPFEIKSLL